MSVWWKTYRNLVQKRRFRFDKSTEQLKQIGLVDVWFCFLMYFLLFNKRNMTKRRCLWTYYKMDLNPQNETKMNKTCLMKMLIFVTKKLFSKQLKCFTFRMERPYSQSINNFFLV